MYLISTIYLIFNLRGMVLWALAFGVLPANFSDHASRIDGVVPPRDMTVDDDARALLAIIAQILAFPFRKEFA